MHVRRGRLHVTVARMVAATALLAAGIAGAAPPPPANGRFDYQLGGAYPPADDVAIVVRDRQAAPVPGRYNICYVNAFQTQPGKAHWWKTHHPDLLVRRAGHYLVDPGWPDELLLDTSSEAKRQALLEVVGGWIDQCARDGFDAVEPDNLDAWLRSESLLTADDNFAFAALLVARAHRAGLAIAQKNAAEHAARGAVQTGFDFAITEECEVWAECDTYMQAYGDQVYEIEYSDNDRDAQGRPVDPQAVFEAACAARGARISVIYRDRGVAPAGRGRSHVYHSC